MHYCYLFFKNVTAVLLEEWENAMVHYLILQQWKQSPKFTFGLQPPLSHVLSSTLDSLGVCLTPHHQNPKKRKV